MDLEGQPLQPKVVFRFHALQRMFERNIAEDDVITVLNSGKAIEDYPDDQPYPSCLKLGFVNGRPIHIVVATNTDDKSLIVITTYEPSADQWAKNFEERKK